MFKKQVTKAVPADAPRRVHDGTPQVRVNISGKPTWVKLNPNGRAVILSSHWYAKVDGVPVRLARDKTAAEQILANKRKHAERVHAGLELPEPDAGSEDIEKLAVRFNEERDATEKYSMAMHRRLLRLLRDLKVTRLDQVHKLTKQKMLAACGKTYRGIWGARGKRAEVVKVEATTATLAMNIVALKSFFSWLKDEKLIGMVPELPAPPKCEARRGALSLDQLNKLCSVTTPTWALFYRLAFVTLARVGALCALRICDVHFPEDGSCFISLLARHAKTKKPQAVPVKKSVGNDLWGHIEFMKKNGATDADLIFPVNRGYVCHRFHRDMKKAGIDTSTPDGKLCPHSLRHGGATRLLKEGANPFEVMRLGGWRTMDMLIKHYGHVMPADAAKTIERFM